ncbi:hypothetical protein [Lacticaseibacillus paracasei]|uniref:hypothetical protein n=1 Tax=Lacticaseibacillus paracasei TaxID=1597 RepID=UPI000A462FB4|nr:hypothetical protein [Lacticaseibacillus paracasei]
MIQDQLSRGHRITVILRALRIPSSTYYDWLKWHPKSRNRRRIKLKELVQVLWQRRKFYGYVRIAKRIRQNRTIFVRTIDILAPFQFVNSQLPP